MVAAQRQAGRSMGEARGPRNNHAIFNKAVKNILSRKLLQELMLRKEALQRHLRVHVYCCVIHNSYRRELAYIPINKVMDKENVVHTGNKILYSPKEK